MRCGCRAPGRSAITLTNCTRWGPNCRWPRISPLSAVNLRRSPKRRRFRRRPGARSLIAAPSPACIHASPKRRATSTSHRAAPADRRPAPLRLGRRIRRRSHDDRAISETDRLRHRRARTPSVASAGGRRLRLPSGADRPAPERQGARTHHRRAFRRCLSRLRLWRLSEVERVDLLRKRAVSPRPLVSPFHRLRGGDGRGTGAVPRRRGYPGQIRSRRHSHLDHFELRQRLGHAGARAADEGSRPHRRGCGNRRRWRWSRCSRRSRTCAPASA